MTKQEAIQLMRQGALVTHQYFGSNEWMTMPSIGTVKTEEGYEHNGMQFWSYRQGDTWEEGYSLFGKSNEIFFFNEMEELVKVRQFTNVDPDETGLDVYINDEHIGQMFGVEMPDSFYHEQEDILFFDLVKDWLAGMGR